jgi:hypothetical protein
VCAVHFGMSGRFNAAAGPAPEVRPTTRLALVNEEHNLVAHLSAMTVKHGGVGERTTDPAADRERQPTTLPRHTASCIRLHTATASMLGTSCGHGDTYDAEA